jgi:predicted TIM-barrel fold metal-dependent hydrolase
VCTGLARVLEASPIAVVFDHFAMPAAQGTATGATFAASNEYARLRALLDEWVGSRHGHAILWDNAARLYQFT